MTTTQELIERLRWHATDWNGKQMVDGEPAKCVVKAGDLRNAADHLERMHKALEDLLENEPSFASHERARRALNGET